MKMKKILTIIISAVFLLLSTSGKHYRDDHNIVNKYEAEKLEIEGSYNIDNDNDYKFLRINKYNSAQITINKNINQKCILWMNAKIPNYHETSIFINDKKIPIKTNSYYFKWIKLSELDSVSDDISINIQNRDTKIEIDCFYLTDTGIAPFNSEYVIDDVIGDIEDKKVKLIFSGEDLTYANLYLYRKMTLESYIKYFKQRYGKLIKNRFFISLIAHLSKSFDQINSKKILDNNNYYIYDENPEPGYSYEYYIKINNKFGQSLKSKSIIIEYNNNENNEVDYSKKNKHEDNNTTSFQDSTYSFKRNIDYIQCEPGFIIETKKHKELYINKQVKIKEIPLFLKDSYYHMGLSDSENITFNFNKMTDVYVYIPDMKYSYEEYYFSKGFELIRIPIKFTDENTEYTYFYYKNYRTGTGDSLYLNNNNEKTEINDNPFSVIVDENDLLIYFNEKDTLLIESDQIYIDYEDYHSDKYHGDTSKQSHNHKNNNDNDSSEKNKMQETSEGLWYYKIENGAIKYKYQQFNFYNEDDIWESSSEWYWNLYEYIKNQFKVPGNVVFFKEREKNNYDINFNYKYHSQYKGLEAYHLDDGSKKASKSNEISYGMNKSLEVKKEKTQSKDNSKACKYEYFIEVEYDALNTSLVDADYVRMVYSYDNWTTSDNIIMNLAEENKYSVNLYPSSDHTNISYYFTDDINIDDNLEAKWEWDFSENTNFNFGYSRNLTKQYYLELKPYVDNEEDDYEWTIELDNGFYDICIIAKKIYSSDTAIIEINGKPYRIDNPNNEIIEIRDRLLIYDNKISMKNTGESPVKIYALKINQDKLLINKDSILPETIENHNLLSTEEIVDEIFEFENNNDIIKASFKFDETLEYKNKLELVFNASTKIRDFIYIAKSNDFNNDLMVRIKLNNDIETYKVDISEYIEEIKTNNNELELFIKGHKGAYILTHKNENAPFKLESFIVLDKDQTIFQAMGVLSKSSSDFIFTDNTTGKEYLSHSETYDIDDFTDVLVMVSGYIEENKIFILDIETVLNIKTIEGDVYTNSQPLTWDIISDQDLTHLRYRIKDVVDWELIPYGTIIQEIENDGEYILEVIPIMNGNYGSVKSLAFKVDRTGPELSVIEDIPEYTGDTNFEIELSYTDNFTSQDEITVWYSINNNEEIELNVEENKAILALPEGNLDIEIYCKDLIGNKGNIYKINTVVDLTKPVINEINSVYDFVYTDDEEIKQLLFFNNSVIDNLTENNDLLLYYNINDGEWNESQYSTITLDLIDFIDGEYDFNLYIKDKAGLISDTVTKKFIIDKTPIDKPASYESLNQDNYLKLTWESKNTDPAFLYYKIRREPVFIDLTSDEINYITEEENTFIDNYSVYNPDNKYFISVVDIYGNESEELECLAAKYKDVTGEINDEVTIDLDEYGLFTLTKDEETPGKIGIIKKDIDFDSLLNNDYGLLEDKIYQLAPEGSVFNTPAIWQVDVSDLAGDIAVNKENLCLYYHNPIKNVWEEIETIYNEQTDKLEAKIHHFSTIAVGEKQDEKVEIPLNSHEVNPTNGSVSALLDLLNLSSYKEDFNLNVNFNSNDFTDVSKYRYNNEDLKTKRNYVTVELTVDEDEVKEKLDYYEKYYENQKEVFKVQNEKILTSTNKQYEKYQRYEDLCLNVNNLDNIWKLNIPELIKDKENEDDSNNIKYLKLDDGITYELKPQDGIYENVLYKKFVFKELEEDDGYIVKTSEYKNYKFDKDGKLEFIFISNDPENDYKNIDLTTSTGCKGVIFSFNYNDDNFIDQVDSYDKNGDVFNSITFEYEKIISKYLIDNDNFIDSQDKSNEDFYIYRINSISKEVKINNNEKEISRITLNYGGVENNSSNYYITAYSHNKNEDDEHEKIIVKHEYLKSIKNEKYKLDGSLEDEEEKILKYETNGKSYKYMEPEKIGFSNTRRIKLQYYIIYWGSTEEFKKVKSYNEPQKMKAKPDLSLASLSKLIIEEKYYIKEFDFDSLIKGKDSWNIFADRIYSYCTEERIYAKDQSGNTGKPISSNYYYKLNDSSLLSPFEKTLKLNQVSEYELSNRNDNNINNRNFEIIETPVNNKYKFEEYEINKNIGILKRFNGFITTDFEEDHFINESDTGLSYLKNSSDGLEEILGSENVCYFEKLLDIDEKQRIRGTFQYVKDESDKYTLQKERIIYNEKDQLTNEIFYINESDIKNKKYEYYTYDTDTDTGEHEEFLNGQVSKIEEDIDEINKSITINEFDRSNNGLLRLKSVEKYHSNTPGKKKIVEMIYEDEDELADKEIINNSIIYEYSHDDLNRIISQVNKGKTNDWQQGTSTITEDVEKNIITNKYYDIKSGDQIAIETYCKNDFDNRTINLYFYSFCGKGSKTAVLYYEDGTIKDKTDIEIKYDKKVQINNDIFNVTGKIKRIEDSAVYEEYYNKIINNDYSYCDITYDQRIKYRDEINLLTSKKFTFDNDIDFISAEQVFSLINLELLKEVYLKNTGTNKILKRYETYQTDSLGNPVDKMLDDTGSNIKFELKYEGGLNNIVTEYSPYSPAVKKSNQYEEYTIQKITTLYKDITGNTEKAQLIERFNNIGSLIYKKTGTVNDNSLNIEEFYKYDYLDRIKSKLGSDESVTTYDYNLYGLIQEKITGSDNRYTKIIKYNSYDTNTGEIDKEYSDILINKTGFNPENDWSVQKIYDDFGKVIEEQVKYDTEIIDQSQGISNGEFTKIQKTYNIYGKLLFEKSDLYTNEIGQTEYYYTYFNELDKKVNYDYDPVNNAIIKIIEDYDYDDYKRVRSKIITRNNEIIDTTLIKKYDYFNNITEQYQWKKGINWIKTYNKYNKDNKLVYSEKSVLNSNDNTLNDFSSLEELITQKEYKKYDMYSREILEISTDGSGKITEYDHETGKVQKEYTGVNIAYKTNSSEIDIITSELGSPKEYKYYENDEIKSEIVKNSSGNIIYEKYYEYDRQGRKTAESIDRYNGNTQNESTIKKSYTYYDSIGREYKKITDNITTIVDTWPEENTDNEKNIITIIDNGINSITFTEITKYSGLGNEIYSIDKDGYKYIDRIDKYGNIIQTIKSVIKNGIETNILTSNQVYKNQGLYADNETISGSPGTGKYFKYEYDTKGRQTNVENYDIVNGVNQVNTIKTFTYKEDDRVESVTLNIDNTNYTITYGYNEAGTLDKIIYPDGKEYELIYNYGPSFTEKNGRLEQVKYDNETIISDINYKNSTNPGIDDLPIISSYKNKILTTIAYDYDEINRIKAKAYINDLSYLKQEYTYDKTGNILSITETDRYDDPQNKLVDRTFTRKFTYDNYNRLTNVSYNGAFSQKTNPKISYISNDYHPLQDKIQLDNLTDNSNELKNIEWGSPSIILTNLKNSRVELVPDTVRIYKTDRTRLTKDMVHLFYKENYGYKQSKNHVTNETNEFIEFKAFDFNVTKALKLKLDTDNTDKDNEPLIMSGTEEKLTKLIEYYTTLDNINISYTYDLMGNRLSKKQKAIQNHEYYGELTLDETEENYTYDNDNNQELKEDNLYKYEYDKDGSLLTKTSKTDSSNHTDYTWDAQGCLRKVDKYINNTLDFTETYLYDESGLRIKSINPDITTIYIYDNGNKLFDITSKTKKAYVYALDDLQCSIENTEYTYYYSDYSGTTRFTKNSSNQTTGETLTSPFGLPLIESNGTDYYYAGHESINSETNLTYMKARWMDNSTGRFISIDPAKDGLNWYVYTDNNPVKYIDPTGRFLDQGTNYWSKFLNSLGSNSAKSTLSYSAAPGFYSGSSYLNGFSASNINGVGWGSAGGGGLAAGGIVLIAGYMMYDAHHSNEMNKTKRGMSPQQIASQINNMYGNRYQNNQQNSMYPQNQSSGSGNLQPPGGGCSTTAAPGDDNCSFYRFLETMQQIHEEYSAKFNYEQSLRQFENSLNELNNVQRQLEYIEQNIKFDKQIAESLKNLGVDYKPSNMDQLLKSSYEGQYHKLVDKVNANLNKTVQNYQQYNNVVKAASEGIGFDSFRALKNYLGPAGENMHWHHIVEKSQICRSGFSPSQIHNTKNIIAIDQVTHAKITGFYNSTYPGTNMTIRDWLTGQSFQNQFDFGLKILNQFGIL